MICLPLLSADQQVKCDETYGGYPGRFAPGIEDLIIKEQPQLFISGHSHILKIMYDDKLHCLHMNAGAVGLLGWHKIRTIIRWSLTVNIKQKV